VRIHGGRGYAAQPPRRHSVRRYLSTFGEGDGALAGKHRAVVRAKRNAADYVQRNIIPRPVIDPRFEDYEKSGLQFTVEPDNNEVTLVVERP